MQSANHSFSKMQKSFVSILIIKRDWTGQDVGKWATLAHTAKGLSPFAMVDLIEDDVAYLQQEGNDLKYTTMVSALELKAARKHLAAKKRMQKAWCSWSNGLQTCSMSCSRAIARCLNNCGNSVHVDCYYRRTNTGTPDNNKYNPE